MMSWVIFLLAVLVAFLPEAKQVSPLIIMLGFTAALMVARAEGKNI